MAEFVEGGEGVAVAVVEEAAVQAAACAGDAVVILLGIPPKQTGDIFVVPQLGHQVVRELPLALDGAGRALAEVLVATS